MLFYIVLLLTHSYADLGCEKFDGAAYDECVLSGKHDTVTIKEEDTDKTEETNCQRYRDAASMKSCLARAHESASQRAKKREERERSEPVKPKASEPKVCEADAVYSSCEAAHSKAQDVISDPEKDNDAKKGAVTSCMSACTRVTPSVGAKLASCSMDQIRKVNALFATNHPTCGVGSSGAATSADDCKDFKTRMCEYKLKAVETDLVNGGTGDKKTCDGNWCTATKQISGDISLVAVTPEGQMQGIPDMYYTDSSGNRYKSLDEARAASSSSLFDVGRINSYNAEVSGDRIPVPQPRPDDLGTGSGGTRTTAAPKTTPEATVADNKPTVNESQTVSPAANPTNNANPFGTPNPSSSQGVSVASNPFAGTGFTGGTGIEGSTRNDYQQSANADSSSYSRFPSNSDSEVTSGGGSSGGGGSGGGFAPIGTSKQGSSTEAVGGGGSGGSSLSGFGGRSGGQTTGDGNIRLASKTRTDDTPLTGAFSGYHKASGTSGKPDGKLKTASLVGKGQKGLRAGKTKVRDCGGNLICIAKYLGGSTPKKRSRGGRGIASLGAIQKNPEIGRGYGDIMSQMEKIHNNMAIDQDGNLEVPK